MAEHASVSFLSACLLPGEMPVSLSRLADLGNADEAVMVHSRHNVTMRVIASSGIADAVADYVSGRRPYDPRSLRVNPRLEDGFRLDQDDFSLREIDRDPFYQEFLRPRGLGWHACALLSEHPNGDAIHLSLKRGFDRGAFGKAELTSLETVMPSLRTAAHFTRAAAALIDTVATSLRPNGRHSVFGYDSRGEAFGIARMPGDETVVALRNGAVHCTDPLEQGRLDAVLNKARQATGQAATVVSGKDGKRWIFRVRRLPAHAEINVAFVAVMSSLDYVEEPSAEWLSIVRELFDMSQAEARIAALIGQGLSVPEIARQSSLKTGTVRNQLKAVFAQTGVTRQTELSVLLSRL